LTSATKGMIGKREFELMKPSAVILNMGRGPVIDEPALIEALQTRRIRGAALDVFDTEPLPETSPFFLLDSVLLSDHCADHVDGWVESAVRFFLEQFARWRNGEPLKNVVDKQAGY
jgi:phosphoglycerate dehydrogenase-like enzyme